MPEPEEKDTQEAIEETQNRLDHMAIDIDLTILTEENK